MNGLAKNVTDLGGYADVIMQGGTISGQSNQLSDTELQELVQHYKIKNYHGSYIDNRMPKKLKNGYYIINLN